MSPRDRIISLPNSHLRQRSVKINHVSSSIKTIIKDMEKAVIDWEDHREHEVGVALAAVQIDSLNRVVVIRNDYNNKDDKTFTVLINPVITKYEGIIEKDFEGCLSIKDIYGKVPRYSKVRVKAIDINGNEFKIRAEGFLARVLQHEIDHLNGKLFIDHIKRYKKAFFKLSEAGNLEQLNYEKDIKSNSILW